VLWLWQHDFAPLHYAENTSLGVGLGGAARLSHTLLWLADWLFNRPILSWLVLGAAWWGQRRSAPPGGPDPGDESRRFLLLWGVAPALMMALLGLAFGTDLQLQWLTAFTLWTVAAAMACMRMDWAAPRVLRAAWTAFLIVQIALAAQLWLSSTHGPEPWRSEHWRNFPSDALARGVAGPARQALGGPIDIVSGPYKEAGALALRLPEHPRVLINGNLSISPWIGADELKTRRVITLFATRTIPDGAHPAIPGWAWRVGATLTHKP